jgi:hypothetical protein
MAIHTSLPIYKVAYDLLSVATDYVQNMPRPFKAAIGGRVRDLCVDLVLLIFKANCARDKVPHLDALLERLEELNLLLRLCRDKRFISTGQYAKAIDLTASVGKQANGWRKQNASSPVA